MSLGLLVGCGGSDQSAQTPQSAANAPADTTLRLLYWQAPTILNPHLSSGFKDSEASRITLEPLASFDAEGNLVLFLAAEAPSTENGGVAADGKSVTWKLKENITWSDGTPFTAADVVFTHQFISDPDTGTTTAGTYEVIESVEALDDYTVKINFKAVNPAWFLVFTGTEGMILPQHLYQDYLGAKAREAPANLMPVGTGPYQVSEFKPGDMVIYQPNPNYRDADSLTFEQIELKGGGDATSAARAVLQTGDADFAYNIQVEAAILKQLAAAGQGEVVAGFGSLAERVVFNFTDPNRATADGERSSLAFPHPFFTDPQVRQAFNLAIDRQTIAEQLYGPTGEPTANFLIAPEQFESKNTRYVYDLDLAAELLEQAGWQDTNGDSIRDKDGVEMAVLFQTSVNPVRQKTQEIIKQSLETLGIEVELKSVDPSIHFSGDPASTETIEHFYADMQMFTTGNTNPDPGAYLKTYTCDEITQKSNNWSKQNFSRYCNPAYDSLWQASATELDPQKRQDLFIQMNDLLVDEAVVLPIVHRADADAVSNQLTGIEITPWDLHTWNIAEWGRP
ncbi:MAG: peptide ABC transporter substrate-binding protein [Leptolyngbyaceae cyanobacterium SL_1_1]|nr:peptide ABC transporter substrate-binding protein [Leptolyngbyaceae cyanobacterium SL_1_1]